MLATVPSQYDSGCKHPEHVYTVLDKSSGATTAAASSAHVQSINPRLIRSLLLLRVTIEINTKKKGKIGD